MTHEYVLPGRITPPEDVVETPASITPPERQSPSHRTPTSLQSASAALDLKDIIESPRTQFGVLAFVLVAGIGVTVLHFSIFRGRSPVAYEKCMYLSSGSHVEGMVRWRHLVGRMGSKHAGP